MAIYKLEEISKIRKGKTPSTSDLSLWKKEVPFHNPTSLLNRDACKFITKNEKYLTRKGAVLFSAIATIGNVYLTKEKSWHNDQITSIEVNNKFCLDKYLYLYLQKEAKEAKKIKIGGTIFRNLKIDYFKKMNMNLPSLETQKQLIDIIEPLEIINALFNEKKLFLFQKLNLIQKEIMNINSKFPAFKLESVANIIKGSSKYTSTYCLENIGEFPVYSSKTTGSIYFSKINSFDFEGNKVLITSDGIYAGTPLFSKENFSITSHCYVITKKTNNFLDKFLFYFFKNDENKIKKLAHGSTREALSKKNLGTFSINLPPLEIQQQIIEILEPLYQQLELVQKAKNLYEKKFNYFLNQISKIKI